MTFRKLSVALLPLLISACSGAFSKAPYIDEAVQTTVGDVTLSDFYVPPTSLDEAGKILRIEDLTGEATLEAAGKNIRFLYTSTEGLSGKRVTAVSGALYFPSGEPPDGGWPLLIWSHGTVGVGDMCAPSFNGRSERDRNYLNPWLERGYAIAASDYQGLGTPGTHPYMDARVMAYNNLDLIQALQSSDFPLGSDVIISGQSQGATAALATAAYAPDYAPGINLGGIIATGIPFFSNKILLSLSRDTDPDAVGPLLALTLYFLTLTEQVDASFVLDEVISDEARPIVSSMGEQCVFDFIDATVEAELTSRNTFTQNLRDAQITAFKRTRFPEGPLNVPVFAGIGTADRITPEPMQTALVEALCKSGTNVNINIHNGANHNQGLLRSTVPAIDFADRILRGEAIAGTCGTF